MKVRLARRAVRDVEDATSHYGDVAPGLDGEFLDQMDAVFERLRLFPHGAPPVEGIPGVRRARMRRFPYGIFYLVEDDELIVLRVLHAHSDAEGAFDG